MKFLYRRIVWCVAPVVAGLLVIFIAFWNSTHSQPLTVLGKPLDKKFKLGVDLKGGTILVYEIDPDKKPENYNKDQLVAALRRRIDPAGLRDIVIRAVSDTRVEIIIASTSLQEVEEVKDLIQRVGSLEFRILANKHDDSKALKAAESFVDEAAKSWKQFLDEVRKDWPAADKPTDKDKDKVADIAVGDTGDLAHLIRRRYPNKTEAEINQWVRANVFKPGNRQLNDLINRNDAGLPPPVPEAPEGKVFKINLNEGEHRVTYAWVEVGKNELRNLALLSEERSGTIWQAARLARREGKLFDSPTEGQNKEGKGVAAPPGSPGWETVLYSRRIPAARRELLPIKNRPNGSDPKEYEYFFLTRNTESGKEVTGEFLTSAKEGSDQKGSMTVDFRFNARGANLFRDLTAANSPPGGDSGGRRFLAIVLDGQVMSAPSLNAVISDAGQISGKFSRPEIESLVNILRSGALPATLKPQPVSENTMGATLGDDTIRAGTMSVLWAFVAVLVFMLVYYRFAGFVACVALLGNLILTVAFMVLVNATFTLPGLAGLVLTLAMAVDANVLIYERLREERERGASLPLAIRNGYDRAFPTVIDTHMSSIFTAVVLYVVGNDQLKGFGISLTVGLIISLFTSLYVTRTLFDLWQSKGWLKKLSMAKLFTRTRINFMGIRYYWFTATVLLTVFGITVFLIRGQRGLNMDFVGGTIYGAKTDEFMTITELRDQLENEQRQKEYLALEDTPTPIEGRSGYFKLAYKEVREGDKVVRKRETREVYVPEKITPEQLRKRAEVLPDVSLELIYHSGLSEGNRSKLFTVRTTEKAADLVAASVGRLLGSELTRTEMKDYEIPKVTLVFPRAVALHLVREPIGRALEKEKLIGKAAPPVAPVGLIGKALTLAGHRDEDRFTLTGEAKEQGAGEQFKSALLDLKKPINGHKLAEALAPLLKEGEGRVLESYQVSQAQINLRQDDLAYPAQVKSVLESQLLGAKVQSTQQLFLNGVDEGQDGRFNQFQLTLPTSVDGEQLDRAIVRFAGELKARPLPVRLENFDSQLAADMQQRALYAILASWGAMLLYLWFRFGNWTFGLAAVLCLIHDLFFTMGIIAFCHYLHGTFIGDALGLRDFKIDLPAVAALLTLVGYSVNDTIVVFDRIREVRGKNPHLTAEMINDSVNQTLSRTVLTSVITWLVVLVLYIWGGEGVHLFAFVMVIGVVIGTYSSIYVASPLLLILGEGAPTKHAREREQRSAVTQEG